MQEKQIYPGLCVIFALLVMVGNLTYQKFIVLFLPFYELELSAGAILYPLSFLITDLITECYSKAKATFCIRLALVSNLLMIPVFVLMDFLPAAPWSQLNDGLFHQVFGFFGMAFLASMGAFYLAQRLDVRLYLWIKRLTGGRYLGLRSNISTLVSLLVDTSLIVLFMALLGKIPLDKGLLLIVNSYGWKLFFTLCNTPLFYLAIRLMRPKHAVSP